MDSKKIYLWFNSNIKPYLGDEFSFEYRNEKSSDAMGSLVGVDFDSNKLGGYIYFWDSGFIGYQLIDYLSGEELIEDMTEEIKERKYELILDKLIETLKDLPSV